MSNHITEDEIQVDKLPSKIQDLIRDEKINRWMYNILSGIADVWDKLR